MRSEKKIPVNLIVWGLYFLVIIYGALDVYHSYLLFDAKIVTEWNPLINYFSHYVGLMHSIILVKAVSFLFLGIVLWKSEFKI